MSDQHPLLQPIQGISLYDYSAGTAKIANGVSPEAVCKALGIEGPVWDEVSSGWTKRMQEDPEFIVVTKFGEYFAQADAHPAFANTAQPAASNNPAMLAKLQSDRYFYEELCGARTAAYEYGLDGAQWIQDNYGISLGDFQQVAMQWMGKDDGDNEKILEYVNYMDKKRVEYGEKFAKEQGGNAADDIEF